LTNSQPGPIYELGRKGEGDPTIEVARLDHYSLSGIQIRRDVMKRIGFLVGLVVMVFAIGLLAQQQGEISFEPRIRGVSAEQELLKLEQEGTNAEIKGDIAFLDRILADDWAVTEPDGSVWTKAQILVAIKSGADKVSAMEVDDMKARVYGDAAVVTGRNTVKGIFKGKDMSGQERWTDTWIKEANRWQCVATHVSKIASK